MEVFGLIKAAAAFSGAVGKNEGQLGPVEGVLGTTAEPLEALKRS